MSAPSIGHVVARGRSGSTRWLAVLGPAGAVAAVVCAVLALAALLAPWLMPHDPYAVDAAAVFAGPSAEHPLGTDDTGRDLLSRLLDGARLSLLGPLLVTALSASAGTAIGVLAAWRGGVLDAVVARVLDVLFAFPGLVLAIIAAALFGSGFVAPVVALSVAFVPITARVMRAAAMRERKLPYVEALRLQGLSGTAICVRHLLPNLAPLLLVQCTVGFGYAMLDLAAISFLGLGVQPPESNWGVMVANGKGAILDGHPEQSLYAAIVIVIAVVAVNLVGERLAAHYEVGETA
ncbi:ABC transporter permease [Amycolatopsis albispora]|uniref:ABC transporter permease n=1 Tax=Amycolatopsis albispora TaxID=1804986 RepID=A0A344L3W6_9PSEU|nr:ABC transporter permease [Amycolatopsis albispora]AXB42740.1 ABC transporter permease [Amycolatopsis albispora]